MAEVYGTTECVQAARSTYMRCLGGNSVGYAAWLSFWTGVAYIGWALFTCNYPPPCEEDWIPVGYAMWGGAIAAVALGTAAYVESLRRCDDRYDAAIEECAAGGLGGDEPPGFVDPATFLSQVPVDPSFLGQDFGMGLGFDSLIGMLESFASGGPLAPGAPPEVAGHAR